MILCKQSDGMREVKSINLAMDEDFNANYVNYINLPEWKS